MKVLLAIDGSPCSREAVAQLCSQPWRDGTEMKVLSVSPATVASMPDPIAVMSDQYLKMLADEKIRRQKMVQDIAGQIQHDSPNLSVTSIVLSGSPGPTIVSYAETWGADLIALGSHGYGPVRRFVLGSVSLSVVLHAHCSVEVVRSKSLRTAQSE